jgi:signal transduction histidine kinase
MLDLVRKNIDLLSAALDAVAEKVVVLDGSGRVVLANKAFRTLMHSAQPDEVPFELGKTLPALGMLDAGDKDAVGFFAGLDRVLDGRAATCTHVCRSAGNVERRWYRVHASRIHVGRWSGVMVTLDDVSDARKAKQALNRLSLRLNRLQEEERERIALELHDSTAQHLAAVSLGLIGLKARLAPSGGNATLFDDIERSLQNALREVQVTSFALYTPRLDEGGLSSTLERFVRTYERQTGISVALRATRLDELPLKLQQTLLRIVQEAMANIHRHAAASAARIHLRLTRESVVLVVADNGRGMDRANWGDIATAGTGIGISGMHARADQAGGELRLKSQLGNGTRVVAQIPLPAPQGRSELRALLPSWLHAGAHRRKRREGPIVRAKAS